MANFTRRDFLKLSLSTLAAPYLLACSRNKERVVNFFNWSTYIDPKTLPRFSAQTGVKVNYSEISDDEEMFAKLRSGAGGYDLVVATDYMIPRLRALNLIDLYPAGVLANLGNIDPKFRGAPYDPDNAFTIPYMWGTTGIGYNRAKVPKPPASWRILWDEIYRGKISILDNARDCVSIALLLQGYDETTKDPAAFQKARELLLRQRPLVKQYSSASYMDSLIAGEISLAMAWSGDVLQAARENPDLDYAIPGEGSYMWVDNLCLVRGSEHREDTLRLVDYLLKPEIAAEIANFVRYACPNAAARPLLDKKSLQDPRVYPTAETTRHLKFHALLDPETTQLWNNIWNDVKVG